MSWLDIKISTGENQTKVQVFFLAQHFSTLGVHNTMHVTIMLSWQIISPLIMGCRLVSIDRYAWHCVRQGCRNVSRGIKYSCTFIWFPPVAILISARFQRVMFQMKENYFLIKSIIYGFQVEVIPWELWSN